MKNATYSAYLLEMAEAALSPARLYEEWRTQCKWGWGDPGIAKVEKIVIEQ